MKLAPKERCEGISLFLKHLEEIIENDPEIADLHDAFENYSMNKYSIGDNSTCIPTGQTRDCGIDFYSTNDLVYNIAQCKIPEKDWLESHPEKIRDFGHRPIDDARDALSYLLKDGKYRANDQVQHLYAKVVSDKKLEGFRVNFFIIIFGELKGRAAVALEELKNEFSSYPVNIILQEIDDIVDDFVIGIRRKDEKIDFKIDIFKQTVLQALDYCYFLGNSADVFNAFKEYGWRLFDLNLRYEKRNSPVNGEIVASLSYQKSRKFFHHYNNGLIVVCQNYSIDSENKRIKLKNAQIINGLQTVKSIYNAVVEKQVTLDALNEDCKIQMKVIKNDSPDVVSKIVQATNNQNPMTARSLKSNNREQKTLRTKFSYLPRRWFLQLKEGEIDSLQLESGKYFKPIVGFPISEFKHDPLKKRIRYIDNQDLAKSWLAFIGFSDYSADRTIHIFTERKIYDLAFMKSPLADHWKAFSETVNFHPSREDNLSDIQAGTHQYFLSHFIWEFIWRFIPAPVHYRADALNEGVKEGKLKKASDSIISSVADQENYLAFNTNYQTWKLMANMKEVLVESVAFILSKRYGILDENCCSKIINSFETAEYFQSADCKKIAEEARNKNDFDEVEVFSRIMRFLQYTSAQFWEEKRNQINSTVRVRQLLFREDIVSAFKKKINELIERKGIDYGWKKMGKTFLETLPALQ